VEVVGVDIIHEWENSLFHPQRQENGMKG
jgi:hypothetical protein